MIRTRAGRSQAGFTLLELLVVIAILSIIAGAFSLYLIRSLRQSELRDAAYQLVGDLRRARSGAQKSGVINSVTITTATSAYALAVAESPPRTVNLTLPHGVTVTTQSGGANVAYQPPFGTLDTTGVSWRLTSPSNANLNLWVKAIGITGKVMVSATQN